MMNDIINQIKRLPKYTVIGISGFGGSGKSTLARRISKELDIPIVGVDEFWQPPKSDDYMLWENIDFTRLEKEVLAPFTCNNLIINYREFDWEKNEIGGFKKVESNGLLIVEGIGLFRPELMDYFGYTIWIDCPIEIAIKRGKRRDNEEYGVNNDYKWDGAWKKNDLEYFREFTPEKKANVVLKYRN